LAPPALTLRSTQQRSVLLLKTEEKVFERRDRWMFSKQIRVIVVIVVQLR